MKATKVNMNWNSSLYEQKYDFVFKFGEDVVALLDPKPGERILDLGCGTGYLTNFIAERGAEVTGMDNSMQMIEKAISQFPSLAFQVTSATDFHFDEPFDAIFSNAVLHWVLDKEAAIDCICKNLKRGGRMVVEFGGKDNVKNITDALIKVLSKHNYPSATTQPWYFPSLASYSTLLEKRGFTVNYAIYFHRDTELKDTSNGIKDWIKMFGSSFLQDIDQEEQDMILSEVQEIVKPTNFCNNKWYADYKRLRIVAGKP